jgi:predicted MFS family arabinose efflux permease
LISENTAKIREATTLGLLITAIVLIPGFILWVGRQERLGRPAVIPNSLWRNRIFSVICVGVFIVWGVFNAIETYLTLFFQDVQGLSAIQTSIRFLPTPVGGALANIAMGLIAHRVRADHAVHVGVFLTTIGALLMCIIKPEWTYWACAFPAAFLNPIGSDVLYTISSLVITSVLYVPPHSRGIYGKANISQSGADARACWWCLQHSCADWQKCGTGDKWRYRREHYRPFAVP